MENNFALLSIIFSLILLQHVVLFLIFLKSNRTAKLIEKFHSDFEQQAKSGANDMAEVLTKMMVYLEKEFDNNFENQKKMQEWFEKNMESVILNSGKTVTGLEQTQRFLGRMSEALGIVQRSNLQDIQ